MYLLDARCVQLQVSASRQIGKAMDEVTIEQAQECAVCLTDIDADDAVTTQDEEIVCLDCSRTCDKCYEVGTEHNQWHMVSGYLWCEDCTMDYGSYCESCEEWNDSGVVYISDRDAYWCDPCTYSCYHCRDCDNYYDQGYCEDCQDSSVIHDYGYRPDPIFHTTSSNERLFFGVEIEVEAGSNIGDASQYAHRLEDMELAYLKSDGSLNCGFEIVTHPMTHDFYKNEATELYETLNTLRDTYRVKSWGTNTCGFHIHISRTGFNGGAHMHRFLNLVYSNQDLYSTIAGRYSDRWAKFDDVNTGAGSWNEDRTEFIPVRSFRRKLNPDRGSDRYSAVNTNNTHTLEMRIFRGSTQPHVIKSYIDLAHASVEYTRTLSIKEVAQGALNPEPFIEYIVSNQKLYPELLERINRLYIEVNLLSASRQIVSI